MLCLRGLKLWDASLGSRVTVARACAVEDKVLSESAACALPLEKSVTLPGCQRYRRTVRGLDTVT